MGQIRFLAPLRNRLPANVEDRIYMAGMEGIPWHLRASWNDHQLVIDRSLNESGYCSLPWLRPDGQEVIIGTSTLREQAEPYLLELELARGVLNRVRNQAALWDITLNNAPQELSDSWSKASACFVQAATTHYASPEQAAAYAAEAIEAGIDAQRELVTFHARNTLAARIQVSRRLNTMLACQISRQNSPTTHAEQFVASFNAACISTSWNDIEPNDSKFDFKSLQTLVNWCQANRLRVCIGPLLCFDKRQLPDWLYLWEDDFDAVLGYATNYVNQVVKQFQGQAHVWEVAGQANLAGALDLNEDQQLQLIVAAINATKKHDPQVPLVVGFCEPWAEYLSRGKWEISPLHVADALVRAEIGVSGFSLEVNLGYEKLSSGSRTLLDLSQLIDRWSQLGAPLLIRLTVPSEQGEGVLEGFLPSPQRQQEVLEESIRMLLCKPAVHGIIYQRWNDNPADLLPHGGLVNQATGAKPALKVITDIRKANLH